MQAKNELKIIKLIMKNKNAIEMAKRKYLLKNLQKGRAFNFEYLEKKARTEAEHG
jgi:hypothetical protein